MASRIISNSERINPHDKKDRGDTGIVTAIFEDGTMAQGTLLVGADGSRSAVRAQLLPELKFVDTGIGCIYGKSPLNSELQIKFPERYRRWITVVQDQTPIIQGIISRKSSPVTMVCEPCHFSNRDAYPHIPEDYVHFGIIFPRDLLGCDLSNEDVDKRLRKHRYSASMDITSEWDFSIRSLIELQDSDLTCGMRIYSAPEVIPAWRTSCRVTVIGDAIHLMSPTGGVGAVAALNDAILLTKVISEDGISERSIGKFEDGLRDFSSACIRRSKLAASKMMGSPTSTA